MELMYHNEITQKNWDIYKDVSCDYRWEVYDLVHEYHTSSHYSGSRASSSTSIHAVWATCPANSKSYK